MLSMALFCYIIIVEWTNWMKNSPSLDKHKLQMATKKIGIGRNFYECIGEEN